VGKVMKDGRVTVPKNVITLLDINAGDLVKVVLKQNGEERYES
jgi:bifunctional DNA-binding transcriptional regulator/antitoxin component of YhaV-PrlF toxin-antitoxin module